ncbi:SMC-Scp complex subunit ScpB [Candidatus Chlorohelix sp.]|uniref:SMC-Scp complex subunit ScpB n=1 Tax=Candidatus Chlorohelix sp. TaxID=3139201 RepID=UPI0030272F57
MENSNISQQLAAIEAILFISAEAVNFADLQKALQIEPKWLEELITTLNGDYENNARGLRIYRHNNTLQIVTSPEVALYIERFLGLQPASRLSAAALETLTIIAYRQPITRQGIEAIRGVDSSGVINTLQARSLIEEVGRAESIGHPVLFGSTIEFLHQFGLKNLAELPPLEGLSNTAKTEASLPDVTM